MLNDLSNSASLLSHPQEIRKATPERVAIASGQLTRASQLWFGSHTQPNHALANHRAVGALIQLGLPSFR